MRYSPLAPAPAAILEPRKSARRRTVKNQVQKPKRAPETAAARAPATAGATARANAGPSLPLTEQIAAIPAVALTVLARQSGLAVDAETLRSQLADWAQEQSPPFARWSAAWNAYRAAGCPVRAETEVDAPAAQPVAAPIADPVPPEPPEPLEPPPSPVMTTPVRTSVTGLGWLHNLRRQS